MPLPDSGWIRALVLQLVTYWMSFPPEQQWAKGLLMIRLRDRVVWQLWHENTERASITRMESAKTAICFDRVGSCIKLFLHRMIYAGQYDPSLNSFASATIQTRHHPPPQKKKNPSKVCTIHDATHCNFYLHLPQQIAPSKVSTAPYVPGSRSDVANGWNVLNVAVSTSDGAERFHQILKFLFISPSSHHTDVY